MAAPAAILYSYSGSVWESINDKKGKYGEYKLLFNRKTTSTKPTNLAAKNPEVVDPEKPVHEWATTKTSVTFDVCAAPFTLPI